jgi:hypothetical protein
MLKIIKAQGAKRKKQAKEERPKDPFEFDGEDEILGVIREINSDNTEGGQKKESASKKRQIEKGSASSTPKKKRSVPVYKSPPKKSEEKKSFKPEKDDVPMGENKSSASTSSEGKNRSVDARSSNGSVKRKREGFIGLEKVTF